MHYTFRKFASKILNPYRKLCLRHETFSSFGSGIQKNIEFQQLVFKDKNEWRKWLDTNHSNTNGIWLRIYKKNSNVVSVSYDEAVDDALCYGWIDGQRKSYDELSFLQKFTPRRANSIWSKKNIENVTRLEKEGRIMPKGQHEIEKAQKDGRWEASYDSQANMTVPEDFVEAVKQNKKAFEFYCTLSRSSLFIICMQLQSAKKPQTRQNRFKRLFQKLQKGQKPS